MFLNDWTVVLLVNDCELIIPLDPNRDLNELEGRSTPRTPLVNKINMAAFTAMVIVFVVVTTIPILAVGDFLWEGKLYFTPHNLVFIRKITHTRTGWYFLKQQIPRMAINMLLLVEAALRYYGIINLRQWLPFAKETFYSSRAVTYFGDERNIIPDIRKKSLYKFGKNTLYFYYKWTKPYEARSLFLWLTGFFIVAITASKITETHIVLTVASSITLLGGAALFVSRGANKASKLKWLFTWNNKYTHQVTNAPLDQLYMSILHAFTTVGVVTAGILISTAPVLIVVWTFWH